MEEGIEEGSKIGHLRVPLCLRETILMEMTLICMKMKQHAELIFALRLVFKQRHERTRKWPFERWGTRGEEERWPQVYMHQCDRREDQSFVLHV